MWAGGQPVHATSGVDRYGSLLWIKPLVGLLVLTETFKFIESLTARSHFGSIRKPGWLGSPLLQRRPALVVLMSDDMQCASVAKTETESTHVMTLTMCVILMCLCIVVGASLGWKLRAWFGDVKQRTVKTQSQTRYAWSRGEPRFMPLPDKEQGVWHDDQPMPSVEFVRAVRAPTVDDLLQGPRDL